MERQAFTLLHEMEASWWYQGRARVVASALGRVRMPSAQKILDFGAGFGGMYPLLSGWGVVEAFEPDEEARMACKKREYAYVYDAVAEIPKGYDLIALFDVVEHVEDDTKFLKDMYQLLSPSGRIAITVPAFPFLWSIHDVNHHHYRRYGINVLKELLLKTGFEVEFISHWNMFLFFPAVLMRLLNRSGEGALHTSPVLNSILLGVVTFESMLIRFLPLPVGVSLVCLARKK